MSDYYEVVYRKDGIWEIYIDTWHHFDRLINDMVIMPNVIYRGVNRSTYELIPSLYRNLPEGIAKGSVEDKLLKYFEYSILGRRGDNPKKLKPNELWALGRHHGLKTPLLDWTSSPFVALFFAFEKKRDDDNDSDSRVVFCLKVNEINKKIKELKKRQAKKRIKIKYKHLLIYQPLMDENVRLISQAGLFTYFPSRNPLDLWIKDYFNGYNSENEWVLLKIRIRNEDRENCLRMLNRMNINHLTLFPDLYGAAEHSNIKIEIDNY